MNPAHPLSAELSSAGLARRLAETEMRAGGFRGDVGAVVLLVSELVTNAVLHARPPIELSLGVTAETVDVQVRDGDARPLPGAPADSAVPTIGGHGLRIVAQVADTWGCDTFVTGVGDGKIVWFTLGLSGESDEKELL